MARSQKAPPAVNVEPPEPDPGQARGVQRMLQEGRSCYEVVMQLAAMRAALAKVAMALIADNLEQCLEQGQDPRTSMDQARDLLMKFS